MNILITGGRGYIGGHVALALASRGMSVVVTHRSVSQVRCSFSLPNLSYVRFEGHQTIDKILQERGIEAVIHLAADTGAALRAGAYPAEVEIQAAAMLIEACIKHNVRQFLFGSSSAVYGSVGPHAVSEEHECAPTNSYGVCKWKIESLLWKASRVSGMRHVIFRLFNVAGADILGRWGPLGHQEQRLVDQACRSALNLNPEFDIFGVDYATPDGSCIRDLVHPTDVADAFLLALTAIQEGGNSATYNCGSGTGVSVIELIKTIESITHVSIPVRLRGRRDGEIPVVVADTSFLMDSLGWRPRASTRDIAKTTLDWYSRRGPPRALPLQSGAN